MNPSQPTTPHTLLRPEVLKLTSYHVPDSKGLIKLDAMENPYHWPKTMVEDWLERLRNVEPNRYPDPACESLKNALRSASGVPAAAGILLGNGSDEIIQIILMALRAGATVMAPEPTFVMYRQISLSLGLPFVGVPLRTSDFTLDIEAFCAAMAAHQPAVVFLAYPNNPTANLFPELDLMRILEEAPGLVVVDEAYAPFAEASFMSRIEAFPRLLVMRTLSKLGLAGLRLGFIAGSPDWISQFEKVRLPYNINVLTQISAEFALERAEVFAEQVSCLLRDRVSLMEALRSIDGVQVFDSRANFILIRLERHDAGEIFGALKRKGILIKNLHSAGPALRGCLRVTVGTPEENHRFLSSFRESLNS